MIVYLQVINEKMKSWEEVIIYIVFVCLTYSSATLLSCFFQSFNEIRQKLLPLKCVQKTAWLGILSNSFVWI